MIARAMEPEEIADALAAERDRLAGSDAERRAARLLAAELGRGGRTVTVETHWLRPRWELAHALCAGLGVAGGIVAVTAPAVGLALALAALAALLLDLAGRAFPLRRLTPERATQNVLAPAAPNAGGGARTAGAPGVAPLRVVLTAHCDAPRAGLLRRLPRARPASGAAARLPGPYAWVAIALAGVAACAAVRLGGDGGAALGPLQLAPTLVLLAAVALLLDAALAPSAPADGIGPAAVVAAVRALAAAPPRHVAVEAVLAGAGAGQALGFLAHLRRHRPAPGRTVVVEVGGARDGEPPTWWTSDGALLPLRAHPRLIELAQAATAQERALGTVAAAGRTIGAALRARQRRIPAIRLTAAHLPDAVALVLALVEALDADRG